MYKPSYSDAGWMLRILPAGSIVAILNHAGGVLWPAFGEFRTNVVIMATQIVFSLIAMLTSHALGGTGSFVVGGASVELLIYPVPSAVLARRKLWQPEIDLPVLAVAGLVIVLGLFLKQGALQPSQPTLTVTCE